MNADLDIRRCAKAGCNCTVSPDELFCSERCRTGIDSKCNCEHEGCLSSAAPFWEPEAVTFFAGRLL